MDCKSVKEMIVRYSSGDLMASEKATLDRHIESCECCKEYFLHSQKLWDTLEVWEEIEPRAEFVTEFWSRVNKEEEKAASGILGWLRGYRPKLAVSGALATVLMVGVFTFALFGPGDLDSVFTGGDEKDELILSELDRATNTETTELLAIYGPWDNSYGVIGNGGMN